MKGLQEAGDGGIFLHVKHGTVCQESKAPREGFVPIEVTNPRSGDKSIKYIKKYKAVEAMVKRIEWYEREHDGIPFMGWKLVLDADGTVCTLDIPLQSPIAGRFMKLAENLDFTLPVEFSAWKSPDDKTAFAVRQNGVIVPQKYTREEPGDCPPPIQGFGKKWNYDAQTQFLHERMSQVVIPKLQALNGTEKPEQPQEKASTDTNGSEITDPLESIKRSVKALANTKITNNATEEDLLQDYFGTKIWDEVALLPVGLLKAQAGKLDDLIPF